MRFKRKKTLNNVPKEEEYNQNKWVVYECVHCEAKTFQIPNKLFKCSHEINKKKVSFDFEPLGFKDYVPKKYYDLVRSKDYGQKLINELDKKIVNEKNNKKVIINNLFGGRLVINAKTTSYNLLFSESSGTGKDYLVSNALKLLPIHFWNHKTRLSEKALSYWHPSDLEPYFTWNGKILYCEDATDYFLNSDTTKVMMSGGSDIAIVDKGQLKSIKINGSPIFVVTSATAEPNKELTRRISISLLDGSEGQTKDIMDFQSKAVIEGLEEYDEDLINSAYLLKRVKVAIPFAKDLLETLPKTLEARTNFDRLLDLIKANCALHQHSRIQTDNDTIQANEDDLKAGIEIFGLLYPSRNTSLTHGQKKIADYLQSVNTKKTATEIFNEVGNYHYSQLNKLIKALRSLANKGIVNISDGYKDGRPTDFYEYIQEFVVSKESKENKVSKVSKVSSEGELTQLTSLTPNSLNTNTDISELLNEDGSKIEVFKINSTYSTNSTNSTNSTKNENKEM